MQSRRTGQVVIGQLLKQVLVYFDGYRLAYTEATILEIMRHKTVGPFSLLRQTSCDTEVGGYFIPRGTMVRVMFAPFVTSL